MERNTYKLIKKMWWDYFWSLIFPFLRSEYFYTDCGFCNYLHRWSNFHPTSDPRYIKYSTKEIISILDVLKEEYMKTHSSPLPSTF